MEKIISISQLIIAVLLIVVILLQNRGTGLGGVFGGESAVFRTKRGLEKNLMVMTVILIILFLGLSIASLLV